MDGKNPPKHPFLIEIAMKTSVDVFYFSVPCYLHCLLNPDVVVSNDEAAAFWAKIPPTNEGHFELQKSQIYGAFHHDNRKALYDTLTEGLALNGFSSHTKLAGSLSCAAKTVNNLPVLFIITANDDCSVIKVNYKAPVAPLKPLVEDCVRFILTR